jgi:hypothetical protein
MPYQSTDALGPKSEVEVDIRSDQAPFSTACQTRSYSKFCLFISVVVSRFILFRFCFLYGSQNSSSIFFFLIKRNHHYQLRPGVKASLIPCNLCDRLRNPLTHTYFFCSHMGFCFALIYMLYKAMERGHPFFF